MRPNSQPLRTGPTSAAIWRFSQNKGRCHNDHNSAIKRVARRQRLAQELHCGEGHALSHQHRLNRSPQGRWRGRPAPEAQHQVGTLTREPDGCGKPRPNDQTRDGT